MFRQQKSRLFKQEKFGGFTWRSSGTLKSETTRIDQTDEGPNNSPWSIGSQQFACIGENTLASVPFFEPTCTEVKKTRRIVIDNSTQGWTRLLCRTPISPHYTYYNWKRAIHSTLIQIYQEVGRKRSIEMNDRRIHDSGKDFKLNDQS